MPFLGLTANVRRDGARRQPIPAPCKSFIDDASREPSAADDESWRHAMDEHIPLIDAEVQERFGVVIVAHEERRELLARGERQARLYAIIGSRRGSDGGIAAKPIV